MPQHLVALLARRDFRELDVILPLHDCSPLAALVYAHEAGILFVLCIIRNHYVGRTFIEPSDHIRHFGVKLKHNANRWHIAGKRVILVDDSIVRGTTSMKIVNMMREAGATEVHMCIASPPTMHSCFYGVDTPERQKLLAAQMDVEAMRTHIGADSLAFISIDGLYRACQVKEGRDDKCPAFCDACFTGDYPTFLTDQSEKADGSEQFSQNVNKGRK